MCDYVKLNKCTITKEICPYVYWCDRKQIWKNSKNMPQDCTVKLNFETPSSQYRVREERKGSLFVDIEGYTYEIKNPFDYIPKYVSVEKTEFGWQIKE